MHNNIINKKRLLTIIINQIRCLQQEYQSKGLLRSKGSSAQNVLAHKIYEHLAMHDYLLEKKHIKELPVAGEQPGIGRLYHISDVRAMAEIVHGREALKAMEFTGKEQNIGKSKIPLAGTISRKPSTPYVDGIIADDIENFRKRFFSRGANGNGDGGESDENKATAEANKVVGFALAMNGMDFLIKLTATILTWSNSLFAETVHSFLDLCNQRILYYGNKVSVREPNPDFPYGYGNMKYICSLSSGFGILAFGCGLSIYNGCQGLLHPGHLESLNLGICLLLLSATLQTMSCSKAYLEVRKRARKENIKVMEYLRSANADPSLKVILFEDTASITGVMIALTCVSLSHAYDNPMFDSVGSILIGCLLGGTAFSIIRANALHLVGRSLPEDKRREIIDYMAQDRIVRKMNDVKATYMGVNDYRFKAEIEYNGRELTRLYLQEDCDMDKLQHEFENIQDMEQLQEFMMRHGEHLIDKLGDEVDRLEREVRDKYPEIRHMDLESS